MTEYIALVRQPPESIPSGSLIARLEPPVGRATASLVFAHGDGVAHFARARDEWAGLAAHGAELVACATSWRRRRDRPPPGQFESGSLMRLFTALDDAPGVECFGLGGCSICPAGRCPGRGSAPPLLIEIAFAPVSARARTEALEIALGAAALELDARVLFSGPGLFHLRGGDDPGAARGWRQISDHRLLELVAESACADTGLAVPVSTIDSDKAAQIRDRAATMLLL